VTNDVQAVLLYLRYICVIICAALALFFAPALDRLGHAVLLGLFPRQIEIVATVCASFVLLLTFRLLGRGAVRSNFLREQATIYEGIIKELPEIACVLDSEGKFKYWNSNLEAALRYTAPEIAQITALDTIAEEQREVVQQMIGLGYKADAIHGDLGTIQKDDCVICISKSGDTPEIKVLVPLLKNFGNKLIAIVGNDKSYLALHADFILNTAVEKEACPNNLAPTSSTTAQLVMGDALAICLMEM
jgi:PAS domain S-box-containing protein